MLRRYRIRVPDGHDVEMKFIRTSRSHAPHSWDTLTSLFILPSPTQIYVACSIPRCLSIRVGAMDPPKARESRSLTRR